MSQDFTEGSLKFSFPDGWLICRPEASSFYRNQFQSFCGGCKEMDFLAYDPAGRILWLIEVKDYRKSEEVDDIDLALEVACKTRDVLAMLPVAKLRDATSSTPGRLEAGEFWQSASDAVMLRVVLHCEMPAKPSRLRPDIVDAANLQMKLTQKLRHVDPRARFTNREYIGKPGHYWGWVVA